ncbi:MAG: hypothetical protein K9N23_04275, partial [Akkermansiaceae bacterium]|nr:hypothetical protein [Akkermansiaceae bacterium]
DKKMCCCCAEDVEFVWVREGSATEKTPGVGNSGHAYFRVEPRWSNGDRKKSVPCVFRWFEWSNIWGEDYQKAAGAKNGEWFDLSPGSKGLEELNKRGAKYPYREFEIAQDDPSARNASIPDAPGFGGDGHRGKTRILLIAATLVSGRGCGCKKPYVTRYIYHVAKINDDGSVGQNSSGSGKFNKGGLPTEEQRKILNDAKKLLPTEAHEIRDR